MEKQYPVYTLKNECNDCYKCIRGCHIKAIRIQQGSASVINEKCIACGHCVQICPAGAKKVRRCVVTLPDNTEAENAVIKTKDGSDVTICGTGTININSNGKNAESSG